MYICKLFLMHMLYCNSSSCCCRLPTISTHCECADPHQPFVVVVVRVERDFTWTRFPDPPSPNAYISNPDSVLLVLPLNVFKWPREGNVSLDIEITVLSLLWSPSNVVVADCFAPNVLRRHLILHLFPPLF